MLVGDGVALGGMVREAANCFTAAAPLKRFCVTHAGLGERCAIVRLSSRGGPCGRARADRGPGIRLWLVCDAQICAQMRH